MLKDIIKTQTRLEGTSRGPLVPALTLEQRSMTHGVNAPLQIYGFPVISPSSTTKWYQFLLLGIDTWNWSEIKFIIHTSLHSSQMGENHY